MGTHSLTQVLMKYRNQKHIIANLEARLINANAHVRELRDKLDSARRRPTKPRAKVMVADDYCIIEYENGERSRIGREHALSYIERLGLVELEAYKIGNCVGYGEYDADYDAYYRAVIK